MEDLNKNQLVLLTLLVSFVTSIATGIITVSLLQQAPVEVTRNINQIVEKTIEKVVPTDILSSGTSSSKKETTTVVVKEDDMVMSSIGKNLSSIVRIKERDLMTDTTNFFSIGLVTGTDGSIISPRGVISPTNNYTAVMGDGKEFTLGVVGIDKKTNFILFKANQTDKTRYNFDPISFASGDVQLGQTLIALGGNTTNSVAVGRVVSLGMKDMMSNSTTTKYVSTIETDLSEKDIVAGSPLFDLYGNVVGIKSSEVSRIYTSVSAIKKDLGILAEK
ncbi:MAG: trypsin-like peptidase domain-containing protein [bacterium]